MLAALALTPAVTSAVPTATGLYVTPPCPAPGAPAVVTATLANPRGVRSAWVTIGSARHPLARVAGSRTRGVYRGVLPAGVDGQLTRFELRASGGGGALAPLPGAYLSTLPPSPGAPEVRLFGIDPGPRRPSKSAFSETMGRPAVTGTLVWFDEDRTHACQVRHPARLAYRVGGYKVRLDDALSEMTTINLLLEQPERFMLDEAMAYHVHRLLHVPAPRTSIVRLTVGNRSGPYLLVEQPNRAFLESNGLSVDGSLYKRREGGAPVTRSFEQKRGEAGAADLSALADALAVEDLDLRWAVTVKNFDMDEALSFFTARALVASWDGYWRNYYLHRDANSVWRFIPWDADQTWGCAIDTDCSGAVAFDLPADGTSSSRRLLDQRAHEPITRPLLEQPRFRLLLADHLEAALRDVFTAERIEPKLRALQATLRPEVRRRAELESEDPAAAEAALDHDVRALLEFLRQRPAFLERSYGLSRRGVTRPSL